MWLAFSFSCECAKLLPILALIVDVLDLLLIKALVADVIGFSFGCKIC